MAFYEFMRRAYPFATCAHIVVLVCVYLWNFEMFYGESNHITFGQSKWRSFEQTHTHIYVHIFLYLISLHLFTYLCCLLVPLQEKDQYGNEVQRLARPLPVEYLLVDVPASTPLQPQFTFTQYKKRGEPFPVENRYLDGHLQDFGALSTYLSHWVDSEYLESISDFHLLLYLYRMDTVPLRAHIAPLLEAVRTKNSDLAYSFKASEPWKLLESLIQASTGSGR